MSNNSKEKEGLTTKAKHQRKDATDVENNATVRRTAELVCITLRKQAAMKLITMPRTSGINNDPTMHTCGKAARQ